MNLKLKRFIAFALLLVLAFAFTLTGCKKKDKDDDDDSPSASSTPAATVAASINKTLSSSELYIEGTISTKNSDTRRDRKYDGYDSEIKYTPEYDAFDNYEIEIKGGGKVDTKNYKITDLNFDIFSFNEYRWNYESGKETSGDAAFGRNGSVYSYYVNSSAAEKGAADDPKDMSDFKKQIKDNLKYNVLNCESDLEDLNDNIFGNDADSEVKMIESILTTSGNLRKGLLTGLASFISVEKKGNVYTIDGKATILNVFDKIVKAVKVIDDNPKITFKEFYNNADVKAILEPITKNVKAADVIDYADLIYKDASGSVASIKDFVKTECGLDLPDAGTKNLDSYIRGLFDKNVTLPGSTSTTQVPIGNVGMSDILKLTDMDAKAIIAELEDAKSDVEKYLNKFVVTLTIKNNKISEVTLDGEETAADTADSKNQKFTINSKIKVITSLPALFDLGDSVKKAAADYAVVKPVYAAYNRLRENGYYCNTLDEEEVESYCGVTLTGRVLTGGLYRKYDDDYNNHITIIAFENASDAVKVKNAYGSSITSSDSSTVYGVNGNVFYAGTNAAVSISGLKK